MISPPHLTISDHVHVVGVVPAVLLEQLHLHEGASFKKAPSIWPQKEALRAGRSCVRTQSDLGHMEACLMMRPSSRPFDVYRAQLPLSANAIGNQP